MRHEGQEPPRRTKRRRGRAIPDEFPHLSEAASGRVNPAVERLYAASAKRGAKVYEALAK